jgi:hypothetical protein
MKQAQKKSFSQPSENKAIAQHPVWHAQCIYLPQLANPLAKRRTQDQSASELSKWTWQEKFAIEVSKQSSK